MPSLDLVHSEPAGTDLRLLTFSAALEGHTVAGQFVTVTVGDHKPAFFALANEPGKPAQLLVKVHGEVAELLGAATPGDSFALSDPMGKGFGIPDDEQPLVILATGSGISAVRPVIEREVSAGLPRPVHFLYGVFTLDHCSFTDRLKAWREAGVNVQLVLSEPHDGWDGMTGFVQQAAEKAGLVRNSDTVVLCGFPGMVNDAKALWAAAGAPEDRVLTNF